MGTEYPKCEQEAEAHEPLLGANHKEDTKIVDVERNTSIAPDGSKSKRWSTFNSGPRPYRDTTCSLIFISSVLLTYAFGFFAVMNANFDVDSELKFSRYNPDSGQCEVIHDAYVGSTPTGVGQMLYQLGAYKVELKDGVDDPATYHLPDVLVPILGTLIITTPASLFMLWLLFRYTREMVVSGILLRCLFPLALLATGFTLCSSLTENMCSDIIPDPQRTFFLVFYSVVTVTVFWELRKDWSGVDIPIQILKPTLQALKQNLLLLILTPLSSLLMILIEGPIIASLFYAPFNSKISPDLNMIKKTDDGCSHDPTGYPCCYVKQAEWVIPYFVLALVVGLWIMYVAFSLQTYVISSTVSQWYFAPAGSPTSGTIGLSLRNAFGPSFGTICQTCSLVSVTLYILNGLTKWAANNSRQSIARLYQFVEPFSIRQSVSPYFAAISGESFYNSARISHALVQRNGQSKVIAETLVLKVKIGMIITFSALHSFVVYGAMYLFTPEYWTIRLVTAVLCGMVLLNLTLILSTMGPLDTTVKTLYVCYAMDKDVGAVSKPEVYNVFSLLPPASAKEDRNLLAILPLMLLFGFQWYQLQSLH